MTLCMEYFERSVRPDPPVLFTRGIMSAPARTITAPVDLNRRQNGPQEASCQTR